MADLSDAIEVLTDPANLSSFGEPGSPMMEVMNRNRMLAALRKRGTEGTEAEALARRALEQLGGRIERRSIESKGLRAGRLVKPARVIDVWFVPRDAVRR